MDLLKLLLSVIVIFTSIKGVTGDSLTEVYCRKDVQPIKPISYNIELTPYINEDDYKNTTVYEKFKSYIDKQRAKGNFIFYGESTMFFKCIDKLNKICLHAINLEIDETATEIAHVIDDFHDFTYVPKTHTYVKKSQTLELYFDKVLLPDSYTYRLIMKFVGSITDNIEGFVKTSYINNNGKKTWFIAAADFRGVGARQIFPCLDEPDIRTTFTITIMHHRNYRALSNSPINHESTIDNSMVSTHFRKTYNISPYHVAVVLSDLDRISENVWCRKNVAPQVEFAQKVAKNATLYLKGMFPDGKFPRKVDHVIVPGFRDEGLQSWGLIVYREADIIYDEKLDVVTRKFEIAHMVARKMVHQYFGNLVGQTGWSYLWLNEGIATFLAMEIVTEFIHYHLMDLLAVQFQHESLRLNDYYNMPLVSKGFPAEDLDPLFSFTYYVKAPVFIRSLLQTLSIDEFKMGLNRYLTTYQLRTIDTSSTTTDKFFNVLQEVVKESRELNMNLTRRLYHWTMQKRYPILQVTRECDGSEVRITLLQRNFNESYPADLYIRVTYTTQSNFNIRKTGWLSPQKPILHLTPVDKNDWIIVNVQQVGYYRVNYDKDNWQRLMKYQHSTEYFNIHVLNRAQIIDDAYYFLLNNRFDFYLFKKLMYYLSKERNYVAWYPMFKIMEEISGFFPFPESTQVNVNINKFRQ